MPAAYKSSALTPYLQENKLKKSTDLQESASAPQQESPSGQTVSGDNYSCWTFCTERGRIKERQRSPKFFRTFIEAKAAVLMDPDFNASKHTDRKFYIAQVRFAVVHETIREIKRPPKRRYIM